MLDQKIIERQVLATWDARQPSKTELQKSIQELEYQRWWLHQRWLQTTASIFKENLTTRAYWDEVGTFVCTLSRQQGKTTLVKRIIRALQGTGEEVLLMSPFSAYNVEKDITLEVLRPGSHSSVIGRNIRNIHLFIDELWDQRKSLQRLLDLPWRSVSIFKSDW